MYTYPRTQGGAGPLNHIGPALYATNYPRSPALFTPAIFTPQGFTTAAAAGKWNPGFAGALISPIKMGGYHHNPSEGIRKIQGLDAEGSASSTASRSSSDEMLPVHGQENHQGATVEHDTNSAAFFTFPMHNSMGHVEIKHEFQNPSEIHKPKPITPGSHLYPVTAMPFVQVAPMHNQGHPYSYSMAAPYSGEHTSFMNSDSTNNRNSNNNNVTLATYAGLGNHMMAINPVFIPPSPGFFMAPTGN